jgi:Reverse transcriptase (RNA-dependent DNA polymerase)
MKVRKNELLIVALYVDDLIIMGNSQRFIEKFKKMMKLEFEMIEIMVYFLVSRSSRRNSRIIRQRNYLEIRDE